MIRCVLLLILAVLLQAATPPAAVLDRTAGNRPVHRKFLSLFRDPACCAARRRDIELYFRHHYGMEHALARDFRPKAIIMHATENDSEAGTYDFFNSASNVYLGGVWSTFVIAPDGTIYQYAPLDRVSKAHYGANDLAVGIELVGHVGQNGSVMQRYRRGDHRQLDAAADLVATLQQTFDIPTSKVFSHQELAHIRDIKGRNPDFDWLKAHIDDRVYLGRLPDIDARGRLTTRNSRLEPYDRYDPGQGVMAILRARLQP